MPAAPDTPHPTRTALVEAALHLFGAKGYEAASTREIAARAGANVAAIAYHFGGKEGLRLACVEAIGGIFDRILPVSEAEPPLAPEAAAARLEAILRSAVRLVVQPGPAEDFSRFLVREISFGGPLVALVAERILVPRHRRLCALWAAATGAEAEAEATRLKVFAMLGQMLYFRIGQPLILPRMGWERMTPERADRIADILAANLRAALAAPDRSAP